MPTQPGESPVRSTGAPKTALRSIRMRGQTLEWLTKRPNSAAKRIGAGRKGRRRLKGLRSATRESKIAGDRKCPPRMTMSSGLRACRWDTSREDQWLPGPFPSYPNRHFPPSANIRGIVCHRRLQLFARGMGSETCKRRTWVNKVSG